MSTQDPNAPLLTQAAIDRYRAELEGLTTDGRKSIAERLLRARELGDLSENAEYHQSKEDQARMEGRIRDLEFLLHAAQVIEVPTSSDSAVPGTIVVLKPTEGDGTAERYLLAPSKAERSDDALTVTTASPMGQAMSGKKVGDEVRVTAPAGDFVYEVVSIEPWKG